MPSSAASAAWRSASPVSPSAACSAASAGSSASIIVLSPGSAFPRDCTPLIPASTAAVQPARSSSSLPAADARDQRHRHHLQEGADVGALLPVELFERLLHPTVHVRPVIAVADRRV